MTLRAVLTCLTAAACAHAPAPEPTGAALPSDPGLDVTLEVPSAGPVHVRVRVPRRALPPVAAEVQFSFLRVAEAAVEASVHPRLGPRLVSAAEDLVFDYDVEVPSLNAPGGRDRVRGSFDLARGRHLALWTLVPLLRGAVRSERLGPAVVRVRAAARVTSSLGPSGTDFRVDDLNALYSGLVLVGEAAEAIGSGGLRFVSFDFDAQALARAAALERRVAAKLDGWVGPRRPLRMMALHAAPARLTAGSVLGVNVSQTAAAFMAFAPDGRAASDDGGIFVHELVHSSLPPEEGLPGWMTEGFAEYYARRLAIELDGLPPEALRESLSASWAAFAQAAPSLRPTDSPLAQYFGGEVLSHCLDVRLRRDRSSLDAVLKRVKARAKGALTVELWEQEIALASAPAGALVLTAREGALDPLSTCFDEEHFARRPPAQGVGDAWLREVVGITAVDRQARSLDVAVGGVATPSQLQVGDAITSVDGAPVVSLEHLREVLLGRAAQATIRLGYSRAGAAGVARLSTRALRKTDVVSVDRAVWLPAKGP